jgi:hypothetical protein
LDGGNDLEPRDLGGAKNSPTKLASGLSHRGDTQVG